MGEDLETFLRSEPAIRDRAGLGEALLALAGACAEVSELVRRGELAGALGAAGGRNVQGEEQKKLDVLADRIFADRAASCPAIAAYASEEREEPVVTGAPGPFLALFDPLDGSSNIDVNGPVGAIVSILERPDGTAGGAGASPADLLQPGRRQAAALYALFGPRTNLVLAARGAGAPSRFTLDPDTGRFVARATLRVPERTSEFAINASNARFWAEPVRRYVEELTAGSDGPRGRDFNMRWVAAMVADVHRILTRGGVFLYPWDRREPNRPGKLRLMYEANPMAFIIEAAGGAATDGSRPILDIRPVAVHQRVPVVLGSAEEVRRVAALYAAAAPDGREV